MSRRIATAHLEVTVADQSLQDHQTRLAAVQQAWSNLGTGAQNFANAFTGASAAGLQQFAAAIKGLVGVDPTKIGQIHKELAAIYAIDLTPVVADIKNLTTSFIALNTTTTPLAQNLKSIADSLLRMGNRAQTIAGQQQQAANAAQALAAQVAQTNAALAAQAANTLQLSQQYAGLLSGIQNYTRAQQQANTVTQKTTKSQDLFERWYIRRSTSIFIAGQQIKYAIEQLRTAAQELDLDAVLTRSVNNWPVIMEQTKRATEGMVSNLQILKSGALMSSFGIPVENLAANMAIIQKLSIRTGQGMEYMMDSFARGVSRLSPAILDNLGLQIKLSEAYDKYASQLGTTADRLDQSQKKQAVLNEVIRQGKELTKDVDPSASYMAALDRTSAKLENLWNGIKMAGLELMHSIFATETEIMARAESAMQIRLQELKKYGRMVSEIAKDNEEIRISLAPGIDEQLLKTLGGIKVVDGGLTSYLINTKNFTEYQYNQLIPALEKSRDSWDKYGDILSYVREQQWTIDRGNLSEYGVAIYTDRIKTATKAVFGLEKANRTLRDIQTEIENKAKTQPKIIAESLQQLGTDKLATVELALVRLREAANESPQMASAFSALAQLMLNTAKLSDIPSQALAQAKENYALKQKQTAEDIRAIALAHDSVIVGKMLLDQSKLRLMDSYKMEETEQRLVDAQKAYAELISKRQEDLSSVTAQQITDAAYQVRLATDLANKAQERKRIDEEANKILKDQSFWTQSMKDAEAARLSNGKSREEIQARMLVLQKLLNAEIAKQRDLEIESGNAVGRMVNNMATFFGYNVLAGANEQERKKRIEDMKTEIVQLNEALKLLKSPTGGGGDEDNKIKPPELDEVISKATDIASTFNKVRNELSLTVSELTTVKFFEDGQEIKDAVSSYTEAIDSLVLGIDRREGKGLFGIFGGEDIPGMIEENSKALEELMKFHRETGIMTDEMMVYRDTLLETNEGLREHLRLWTEVTKVINDFGSAATWAFEGAKGIFSDQFLSTIDSFVTKIGDLAGTIEKGLNGQANAYDMLGASLGIARVFTNEYIKNLRARAAVEAAFNAAMAFASWDNPGKMAAHIAAAVAFSVVAGGGVRLPGQASGRDQQAAQQAGPLHIHLYSEMAMTDAERGYLIDRAVAQAAAEGRV